MTEKAEKNKSGAGKFLLGAALGAAVGAIASKFIKFDSEDEEEEFTCPKCEKDGKKCECHKEEKVAKEAVEKKPVAKKTAEKK